MPIKCGHCGKSHRRVDQVKACSFGKGRRLAKGVRNRPTPNKKKSYESDEDIWDENRFTNYPSYNARENIDFNADDLEGNDSYFTGPF